MYRDLIEAQYETLDESGDEVRCLCPFHNDQEGKFYVNVKTGLYICFSGSCGEKGKVQAPSAASGLSLATKRVRERVRNLKDQPAKKEQTRFPEYWLNQFDVEHPYWASRGFSERTIELFRLGYDPLRGMVTIPVRDPSGNIIGVIHRKLDDTLPKYLNPSGLRVGASLFGSWLVARTHRKVALVEGPADAIANWDANIPTLAMYGSRLTEKQASLLRQLGVQTIVIMTDNDKAGREAVTQIKSRTKGLAVNVGTYEPHWGAKDPGELSKVRRKQMFHTATPFHHWKKRDRKR